MSCAATLLVRASNVACRSLDGRVGDHSVADERSYGLVRKRHGLSVTRRQTGSLRLCMCLGAPSYESTVKPTFAAAARERLLPRNTVGYGAHQNHQHCPGQQQSTNFTHVLLPSNRRLSNSQFRAANFKTATASSRFVFESRASTHTSRAYMEIVRFEQPHQR